MAGKSKTKTINQEEVIQETNDIDLIKENEKLKNEIAELKAMIQSLMAKNEKASKADDNNVNSEFFGIPLHKPIKVMSLFTGGLNLKQSDNDPSPYRFNSFGEVLPIIYNDLIKIISNQRKFFEEGYCVILDEDVIKAHGLDRFMDKILDKTTIEKILEYDDDKIKELFSKTTKQIRETIVDLIVDKIIKREYVDRNKIAIVSELYGKDLYEIAEQLK